jgi:hypothetical protein
MNRQNVLANMAQGAKGPTRQNHSRPSLTDSIFVVAPLSKSKIFEQRKVVTTALAADFYRKDF